MADERIYAFGTRLRELRLKKGLSQQDLADRCYGVVSKSNISRLETRLGQKPTLAVVEVLSKALDWLIDEARQLAGYSPAEIDWSEVTTNELIYVLEKYPLLSDESREFVREHISATIGFLLELENRGSSDEEGPKAITPTDSYSRSIYLNSLMKKKRDSDKKDPEK